MGEAFLDNAESDNALKISIPISELFCSPTQIVDAISSDMKDIDKLCITPVFLSESEKDDEYYERIRFEKFFCENYDKLADYKDKVYLQVRTASGMKKNKLIWEYEYVSLERLKEISDKIEMFTDDIKKSSLSPFEKTMALYFISTHFIESTDDLGGPISSSAMHILSEDKDNYKIVCAGYTDLFCRMAYECGIHTKEMQMDWDDSTAGHSVAIVDLDDEKYGIHGSFICDVRTESDFREEYRQQDYNGFNYFCLPFEDFNAMSIFNPNRSNMSRECWYAINNFAAFGGEGISNERIKIDDIFVALNHLYKFIFENDGKSSILKEHDFDGIRDLNTIRDRIDEINEALYFQSFENTADELSQMMVSEEVNKARVSDNSRGK